MPKLLILAPCDNVLINKEFESASLVVILTQIAYPERPDPIPENALAPMRWFIFCQWIMLPEDVGVTFEQRIQMEIGTPLSLDNIMEFTGEAGKVHLRMIASLLGFPILQDGIYDLIVSYRKKGEENWIAASSYPLKVGSA